MGRRSAGRRCAEISGKETLRCVDLARINTGAGGQVLLDPRDIVIGDLEQASSWQVAVMLGMSGEA